MGSPEKTPSPARPDVDNAPNAPAKPKRPGHIAWADMVNEMDVMPVEEARKLQPKDIGVSFGPVMDEAQMKAYRQARKGQVRILR